MTVFPRAPGRSASEVKSTQGQLNVARRRRHSIGEATCASLRCVRRRRTTLLCGLPPVPRGDGVSCLAPTPAPRGAEGLSEASALLSLWACSVCAHPYCPTLVSWRRRSSPAAAPASCSSLSILLPSRVAPGNNRHTGFVLPFRRRADGEPAPGTVFPLATDSGKLT